MNFLSWILVGGLVSWLASKIGATSGQQDVVLNIVVGVAGALVGGSLVSPLVGVAAINQEALSVPAIAVSLVGAIILLTIVNVTAPPRAMR